MLEKVEGLVTSVEVGWGLLGGLAVVWWAGPLSVLANFPVVRVLSCLNGPERKTELSGALA